VRTTFLWQATAYQRLAVKNHGDHPIAVRLTLGFGNDFADAFTSLLAPTRARGPPGRRVFFLQISYGIASARSGARERA